MGYVGGKLAPSYGGAPNKFFMRNAPVLVAAQGREVAEKNTPVDTGDLRGSWKSDKVAKRTLMFAASGMRASWANDTSYAAHVNYGTGLYGPENRKYLILPKKPGGTLHWVNGAGQDVFSKGVMHPGSPGNYMLEISADAVEASWGKTVRPLLKQWARMMERQNPTAR